MNKAGNKKGFVVAVVMLLCASLCMVHSALAIDDTFTLSVTGEFIQFWTNQTWDINNANPVSLNTNYTTMDDSEVMWVALGSTNVDVDFKLKLDTNGTVWGAAAVVASDDFVLHANKTANASWYAGPLLTSYITVVVNHTSGGGNFTYEMKMWTPTATTTGVAQTITMGAQAIQH